jgi:hypothetical protein
VNSLLSQGAKTLVTLLVNTFVENRHHGVLALHTSIGDGDEREQTSHVSLLRGVTDGRTVSYCNVSNFQTMSHFRMLVDVGVHVPRLRQTSPTSSSSIMYRNSYSKMESTIPVLQYTSRKNSQGLVRGSAEC